jgi:thioester reductase-like protein
MFLQFLSSSHPARNGTPLSANQKLIGKSAGGYIQMKWVARAVDTAAGERGLPVIYRPGHNGTADRDYKYRDLAAAHQGAVNSAYPESIPA